LLDFGWAIVLPNHMPNQPMGKRWALNGNTGIDYITDSFDYSRKKGISGQSGAIQDSANFRVSIPGVGGSNPSRRASHHYNQAVMRVLPLQTPHKPNLVLENQIWELTISGPS
jgi:hypothetical protein